MPPTRTTAATRARRRRTPRPLAAAILAALVGIIGLTGCSSSESADGTTRTREISDVKHSGIPVPAEPRRVVTLSEPTLDGALALGVTPVGTISGRGLPGVAPYLADKARDLPIVGGVGKPDIEKIAALKPDLILTDGTSMGARQDLLDQLHRIAPVVYSGHAGGDWKDNLRIVGDALNRGDRATGVIGDHEATTSALNRRLAPGYGDKSFSIVRWQGSGAGLILKELLAGRALTDVGLRRPASQDREGPGHSEPVATEKLGDIDADVMFFGTLGGSSVTNPGGGGGSDVSAARAAIDKARATPGFAELGAVRANRVIPVDGYWTSAGGPLLMRLIVSDIDRALP